MGVCLVALGSLAQVWGWGGGVLPTLPRCTLYTLGDEGAMSVYLAALIPRSLSAVATIVVMDACLHTACHIAVPSERLQSFDTFVAVPSKLYVHHIWFYVFLSE